MTIYAGICQTVNGFFRALDDGDYDTCCTLFAPAGHWRRQGRLLEGRGMIRTALEARPARFLTRHLIANMLLGAQGERTAAASFYAIVFAHQAGEGEEVPPVPPPALISVYDATLVLEDGRWLIAALASQPSFRG